MTKINISERWCGTCKHKNSTADPSPCDAWRPYGDDPIYWVPHFYCPSDCEAAVRLREERDATLARAKKAEAEVARLLKLIEAYERRDR